MPFDISTIETELSSILSGITSIQEVSDENVIPAGFPSAAFQLRRQSGKMYDTANNLREYVFVITIYQEIQKAGKSDAKRILHNVVSDITDELESNQSLNGAVDWCTPVSGAISEVTDTAHGAVLMCQIELTCKKLIQIT